MVEGSYLYCIREKPEDTSLFSTKGIGGKGEVFTLAYRQLEAVVSKVFLEEFASEEIQKKAREDVNWIKEKAIAHEKVIEEAMREKDKLLCLIPMRFGTIFKEEAKLKEMLEKDYLKIKKALNRIQGKQEWSVKVYLKNKKKFEQVIKKKNEAIERKEREMTSLPEGMAFFIEEELKETVSKEMEKELNKFVETFFESFRKHALASAKGKILSKDVTGRREPMVLNAIYLITKEKIEDFKKETEELNGKIRAEGFSLEYSGPWPPYDFVSY